MYVTQSPDTTKEAEIFQIQLLRKKGAVARWNLSNKITRRTRILCLRGIQSRENDPEIIKAKFAKAVLGSSHTVLIQGNEMTWTQDPSDLAKRLHSIFETEGIPYYVTGGVSSSIHGIPRSTIDIDVVIQISSGDLDKLASVLESNGFYVPLGAIDEAKRGSTNPINITDQETVENVDIIISSDTPFDRSRMMRRRQLEGIGFYVCSAEDSILKKLEWRKRSLSEKQWTDVLGIIKIQMDSLDFDYLKNWASNLGISEDLERAIESSRSEEN